jgi:hypothetical protein
MKKLIAVSLLLLPLTLQARVEPREGEEAISAEPKITIVDDQDKTLRIHQINGKVYGIKVVPKQGKPYNLIDPNGEGNFIRSSSDRILVPEWVLISW